MAEGFSLQSLWPRSGEITTWRGVVRLAFRRAFASPIAAVLGAMVLLSAGEFGRRADAAERRVKVDDNSFKWSAGGI
jgi:hypothetical protein